MDVSITSAWGKGWVNRTMATRPPFVDISPETYCHCTTYSVSTISSLRNNLGCSILEPRVGEGRCVRQMQYCIFRVERDHGWFPAGVRLRCGLDHPDLPLKPKLDQVITSNSMLILTRISWRIFTLAIEMLL